MSTAAGSKSPLGREPPPQHQLGQSDIRLQNERARPRSQNPCAACKHASKGGRQEIASITNEIQTSVIAAQKMTP